jgi:hypothetical protein
MGTEAVLKTVHVQSCARHKHRPAAETLQTSLDRRDRAPRDRSAGAAPSPTVPGRGPSQTWLRPPGYIINQPMPIISSRLKLPTDQEAQAQLTTCTAVLTFSTNESAVMVEPCEPNLHLP